MDPSSLMPEHIKQRLADGVLDRLAETATPISRNVADYFRSLKSDSELREAMAEAFGRALSAFERAYSSSDPQLVNAIVNDTGWLDEETSDFLEIVVSRPASHTIDEVDAIIASIDKHFQYSFGESRVRQAIIQLLSSFTREVLCVPQLQKTYATHASIITASNTGQIAVAVDTMRQELAQMTQKLLESGSHQSADALLEAGSDSAPGVSGERDNARTDHAMSAKEDQPSGIQVLRSRREYVYKCMELLSGTRTYRGTVVGPLFLHPIWYSERRAERRQLPDYEHAVWEFILRECRQRNSDIRLILRNTRDTLPRLTKSLLPGIGQNSRRMYLTISTEYGARKTRGQIFAAQILDICELS